MSRRYLVHVDSNGADVRSADWSHRKEAVLPVAVVDDALVHVEQALEPTGHARVDAEQFARKVSSIEHGPVCGRVEAVVVAGRQVDDAVKELVVRIVQDALLVPVVLFFHLIWRHVNVGDGIAFILQNDLVVQGRVRLGPSLFAEKGFQRVVDALDLLQIASGHLTEMQNLSVTGTYLEHVFQDEIKLWAQELENGKRG